MKETDNLLSTECARSAQCIGYKHHYQECVERVTAQHEDESYKGPKEDCVEECKRPPILSDAPVLTTLQFSIYNIVPPNVLPPSSSNSSSKPSQQYNPDPRQEMARSSICSMKDLLDVKEREKEFWSPAYPLAYCTEALHEICYRHRAYEIHVQCMIR